MIVRETRIGGIPALVYGAASDKAYICVHGKMGSKRDADAFAQIAVERGWQVLSFDLPDHGDRKGENTAGEAKNRCTVFDGMRDLAIVLAYAKAKWRRLALFGCSIGAYFSLMAFQEETFEKCLFQSPVVDMPHLIGKMFVWFGVDAQRLEREGEIETPVDVLSWPYYSYAVAHPVQKWASETHILYAEGDDLQDADVMRGFADAYGCRLTVAQGCDHAFMAAGQPEHVRAWLIENI